MIELIGERHEDDVKALLFEYNYKPNSTSENFLTISDEKIKYVSLDSFKEKYYYSLDKIKRILRNIN
mgnify:CR=1 FL=1